MAKVTQDDIVNFNELYVKLKTYAAVARETGFSATTISKYIKKDFTPAAALNIVKFDRNKLHDDVPNLDVKKLGNYCVLSNDEQNEIKELWKELSL